MAVPIARAYNPVEVDLWGHAFETVDLPRSAQKQAGEFNAAIAKAMDEDDGDGFIENVGKVLDLKLRPADGKRLKASTLIKRKWEADELTIRQTFAFLGAMGRAEAEEMTSELEDFATARPT